MGNPDTIRQFLASEEFWPDIDGDKSSDLAWHFWLQPKYDQAQRRKWLESHRSPMFTNTRCSLLMNMKGK
jgi:hypothetical protein